ncbi:putative ribonuclease H-like domain-containing protein [Tanacetum coccineum]
MLGEWSRAKRRIVLQFKILKVWILVDLPYGNKAIGTKWVYRNKKDERGVVVRNKARIEAIRIFLAFASYMGFIVYQMDVKSAFFYGKIDEEVYVSQPPGFIDPKYPQKVYKVVKALFVLHQAPKAWVISDEFYREESPSFWITSQTDKQTLDASKQLKDPEPLVTDEESHLWACFSSEYPHLTWKPSQIVTMLEQILTLFYDADGIDSLSNQAIFDAIQLMAHVEPPFDPSPRPSPTPHIPDSILESSDGNQGGFRSSQGNSALEGTDQEAQEEGQPVIQTPRSMDEECFL